MAEYANYHIDTFLTNLSIARKNRKFVAERVFPVVPVDIPSDKYPIFNKETFLRAGGLDAQNKSGLIRRPGTRSAEIVYDLSNQSYYCEEIAQSYVLTARERNSMDKPLRPDIQATNIVTDTVMLANELQVAKKVMTRGNYASANKAQLVTTTTSWAANAAPYSTSQTSFPISVDIPAGKKAVMKSLVVDEPNRILMNYSAATTLAANWEYKDKFRGVSTEGLTSAGLVPLLLGLETIVAPAQYVTSAQGVAVTTDYIWKDDNSTPQDAALIYYAPDSAAGIETVSFGLTFEAPDDETRARGFGIFRWLEPWKKAEYIECSTTRDWRYTCTDGSTNGDNSSGYADGGYLISGVTI